MELPVIQDGQALALKLEIMHLINKYLQEHCPLTECFC